MLTLVLIMLVTGGYAVSDSGELAGRYREVFSGSSQLETVRLKISVGALIEIVKVQYTWSVVHQGQ